MTERRRFPRIQLETVNISSHALSHALVTGWKKSNESAFHDVQLKVYDISFLGLAIDQVAKVSQGQEIVLTLQLGASENIVMKAKVVRQADEKLALELFELDGDAHLAIDRFLQQRLIGYQMRLVTKKFYNPNEGFDYWFHGPRSTNLLLWMDGKKLGKAFFETDGDVLLYEQGQVVYKLVEESEDDDDEDRGFHYEYDIDFLIKHHGGEKPTPQIVRRFLQIVGQIPEHTEVIAPFRQLLEQQMVQ